MTKVTDQEVKIFNEQCKKTTTHIYETLIKKFVSYGKDSLLTMGQQGVADTAKMKAVRLINILKTGNELEDNSIEDSWRDLAGWSVLGLMLYWGNYPGLPNATHRGDPTYNPVKSVRRKPIRLVYLAGPIDLCSEKDAKDWRDIAIQNLGMYDISTFCPAHAFKWFGDTMGAEKVIEINNKALEQSDAVLFNIPEGIQTIGTIVELKRAAELLKPVVIRTDIEKSLYLEPYIKERTMTKAIERILSFNE